MAHFAIVCPEEAGHLLSLGPLGNELVRRGHRVTVVGREKAAGIAEQLGLPLHQLQTDDVPRPTSHLLWLAFSIFGEGWRIGLRDSFRWRAEAILRKLPQALQELAIDGVIVDQTVSAAGTAAEHVGLLLVTVCTALPWNEEVGVPPPFTSWPYAEGRRALARNRRGYAGWHWYIRPELKIINRYRKAWKLRPLRGSTTHSRPWPRSLNRVRSLTFRAGSCPRTFITSARWPPIVASTRISGFPGIAWTRGPWSSRRWALIPIPATCPFSARYWRPAPAWTRSWCWPWGDGTTSRIRCGRSWDRFRTTPWWWSLRRNWHCSSGRRR